MCNCAKKSSEKWQKLLMERELRAKYSKSAQKESVQDKDKENKDNGKSNKRSG